MEAVLPFIIILAAFYLLIIRPARNRQKAQQRLLNTMEVGSRVLTTSGLYGTIASLGEDEVMLEVAPGTTLRFARGAIAKTLEVPAPEPEPATDEDAAVDTAVSLDEAAEIEEAGSVTTPSDNPE